MKKLLLIIVCIVCIHNIGKSQSCVSILQQVGIVCPDTLGMACENAITVKLKFTSTEPYTTWTATSAFPAYLGFDNISWSANVGDTVYATIPSPFQTTDDISFIAYPDGSDPLICGDTVHVTNLPTNGCDWQITHTIMSPESATGANDAVVQFHITHTICENLDPQWVVILQNTSGGDPIAQQNSVHGEEQTMTFSGLTAGTYTITKGLFTICTNDQTLTLDVPGCTSGTSTYYFDNDHDGFGVDDNTTSACTGITPTDYANQAGDCNDANATINPGATEINANGIDENCDGTDPIATTPTIYFLGYTSDEPKGIGCPNAMTVHFNFTAPVTYTSWTLTSAFPAELGEVSTWTANTGETINALIPAPFNTNDEIVFFAYPNIEDGETLYIDSIHVSDLPTKGCDEEISHAILSPESATDARDATVKFTLTHSLCANLEPTWVVILHNNATGEEWAQQEDIHGDKIIEFNASSFSSLGQTGIPAGTYTVTKGLFSFCDQEIITVTIPGCAISVQTVYADNDGDTYGDENNETYACDGNILTGFVLVGGDCDDNDNEVNPGMTEIFCNGIDDDCNGTTDEGSEDIFETFYYDGDNDGYGRSAIYLSACTAPEGFVSTDGDCVDNDSSINPGAIEVPDNGIDDDCDGQIDEIVVLHTYYADYDGDGYGNPFILTDAETQPTGYVTNDLDCDDSNADVHPSIPGNLLSLKLFLEVDGFHGEGVGGYDLGIYEIVATADDGYVVSGMKEEFSEDYSPVKVWIEKIDAMNNIEWEKTFGDDQVDMPGSTHLILQTNDGGYLFTSIVSEAFGEINSVIGGGDAWVVKLDGGGNIEWQQTYGGTQSDEIYNIQKTSDGGYVMAGSTASDDVDISGNHGSNDVWILKINSTGTIEWSKCFGGSSSEFAQSVQQTADGEYVVAGTSNSIDGDVSEGDPNTDWWLLKLDMSGNLLWERSYGGSFGDVAYDIELGLDGNYIFSGDCYSNIANDGDIVGHHPSDFENQDIWVMKTDSDANILWQKCLGGSNVDAVNKMIKTTDNKYVITGVTNSPDGDVTGLHAPTDGALGYTDLWIVAIDESGTLQWQKTWGGSNDDGGISVSQLNSGDIAVAASSYSIDGDVPYIQSISTPWVLTFDYLSIEDICNSVDDDCDGEVDEDAPQTTYYADDDNDEYGQADQPLDACIQPLGYVTNDNDCNDADVTINPDATEICNALDDDCDGVTDDDVIIASVTPAGSTTFCNGGSVTLNANTGTGYAYTWKKGNRIIAGEFGSSYTATNSGNYKVEINVPDGCTDLSDGIIVTRIANPNAIITNLDATTDLCIDPSIRLRANNGTGFSYQWNRDGNSIPGATARNFIATAIGNYTISVTNTNGCSKTSTGINIIQNCRLDEYETTVFKIYPNPTDNNFIIDLQVNNSFDATATIHINNLTGELIYTTEKQVIGGILIEEIQLENNLPNGIYSLRISFNGSEFVENLIIAH